LNWLDIAILVTIGGIVLAAFSAGLIREVIGVVTFIAGIVGAGLLLERLASDVLVFIDIEDVGLAVSFIVLFAAVDMLGQISAYMLKKMASLLMLGWIDRLGGAFFGLIKGLLIVEVLLLVLAAYPGLGLDGAVDGSAIAPLFVEDVDWVLALLPGDFESRIDAFLAPGVEPSPAQ
jgi:membrane protein required for colicin V production